MSHTAVIITPQDHGRRMSLAEFDHAEAQEGRLYELGRGEVIVVDIPGRDHYEVFNRIRQQLSNYEAAHPGVIHGMGGGSECKILVEEFDSERHPDYAVYKTPSPAGVKDIWSLWVPEIVIEIVSRESEHRDYVKKPEEYLAFGIQEYWIIDPQKQQATILQRSRGRWARKALGPDDKHMTHLLPGFTLDLRPILAVE